MQTLEQLKSGTLKGSKSVKLSCALSAFPLEILDLADTLEILDLTDNQLSKLPDNFYILRKLRILFISNNQFTSLPTVLAQCPQLSMIGFRNNHISSVAENSLPLTTRWLILTDNHIEKLPDSMGDLSRLQKCMLSGNKLSTLPPSMHKCQNLELLRIAVNNLTTLPSFLLTLPKLSWLAYSGNPFCEKHPQHTQTSLPEIRWGTLKIQEILGEGASGEIFKASVDHKEVALKVFKGEISSDGLPQEEMDIHISLGKHPHLVDVLARVIGHPEDKDVLMLAYIPSHFFNLGLAPTLESCSRDVYPEGFTLSLSHTIKILQSMASAARHIHAQGIMHGDFYAHNIMIDHEANSILGDFGGASYYATQAKHVQVALERLEVRAFACLIEELLQLCQDKDTYPHKRDQLIALKEACLQKQNDLRPLFHSIYQILKEI